MTQLKSTPVRGPTAPFDEHLKQIMDGIIEPPHYNEIDPETALATITLGGQECFQHKRIKRPDDHHRKWAIYFLSQTQGGWFDGSGIVIWYDKTHKGRAARFEICIHAPVAGAGADPRRGWRPARCKLCGLDMTVDSGD